MTLCPFVVLVCVVIFLLLLLLFLLLLLLLFLLLLLLLNRTTVQPNHQPIYPTRSVYCYSIFETKFLGVEVHALTYGMWGTCSSSL